MFVSILFDFGERNIHKLSEPHLFDILIYLIYIYANDEKSLNWIIKPI